MKLWMSAEIQADADDAYREARKVVEASVNKLLEDVLLSEKSEKWTFIAIILESDQPDYDEVAKRSSRGQVLEFRLKIPRGEFLAASPRQRVGLVFKALSRSVTRMSELKVSTDTQATLQSILVQAENNLLS